MRLMVLVLVAAAAVLGGCSADPGAAIPQPAPTTTTAASTPGDAFADDVLDTPGLSSTVSRADLIAQGQVICGAIPHTTRDELIKEVGASQYGPSVAEVLVSAAERSFCPGRQYAATPAQLNLVLSVTSVRGDFGGYIVNDHTGPATQTTFNVDRSGKWTKTITVPRNAMVKLDIAHIGARCEIRNADTNELLIEDENSCIVGS